MDFVLTLGQWTPLIEEVDPLEIGLWINVDDHRQHSYYVTVVGGLNFEDDVDQSIENYILYLSDLVFNEKELDNFLYTGRLPSGSRWKNFIQTSSFFVIYVSIRRTNRI